MSNEDDVMQKQQKLAEIKEIMSQFQEKLNSTTKELNDSIAKNSELENQLHDANTNITELNNKIKELENILSQKEEEIHNLKVIIGEKDKMLDQKATQEEQVKRELQVSKIQEIEVEYEGEERKTCANCGAVGQDIKVIENRDKILDYMDHKPIYARKNICKKCGHEF